MAFNFTFSLVCILKCMQHLLNVLFNLAAVNFHQCPLFSHPLWPICLVHSPPPAPVEVRFLVCLQAPSLEGKKRKLNSQEASVLPSPTPAVAPESITQTSHGPLSWAKFFKHFLKKKRKKISSVIAFSRIKCVEWGRLLRAICHATNKSLSCIVIEKRRGLGGWGKLKDGIWKLITTRKENQGHHCQPLQFGVMCWGKQGRAFESD